MLKQWKNFFEKFVNERNYFRKKGGHKIDPCTQKPKDSQKLL